jgi:hypothetical protein
MNDVTENPGADCAGVRLQHASDGAVNRFGWLHLPSGQRIPIAANPDDWAALKTALKEPNPL